jgi:hypothetical protein
MYIRITLEVGALTRLHKNNQKLVRHQQALHGESAARAATHPTPSAFPSIGRLKAFLYAMSQK